ncbi:MAG: hypothetical protein HOO96_31770 [Polyangiaceae bacterium]|nr:hypothetical protein [Polyangiaceae bacterium]
MARRSRTRVVTAALVAAVASASPMAIHAARADEPAKATEPADSRAADPKVADLKDKDKGDKSLRIVVWPTLTPAGDTATRTPMHRPTEAEPALFSRSQELDVTLRDAVQDLGFQVDLAEAGPDPSHSRDLDLLERATQPIIKPKPDAPKGTAEGGTWVVSARIEALGGDTFLLRIIAVPPGGRELRVRVGKVNGADVSVRGLVMLRDMLSSSSAAVLVQTATDKAKAEDLGPGEAPRSAGRAVLAVHGAVFGGFTAFALQRSTGSEDPRVLFPLLAVGTGVGIGSALLISAEWDVTTGNAWYVTAGSFWGTFAGIALANGTNVNPFTDRYTWGVVGGVSGLGLATLALVKNKMDEGDAVLTHSGGGLGFFGGAVTELLVRGSVTDTPQVGAGLGAAAGVISMGALSTLVKVSPGRVLLMDLGAGLGALGGAALTSPLLFENVTPGKARGFLAATLAGTTLGAATAWYVTRDLKPKDTALFKIMPNAGVIGSSDTPKGAVPAYGAGLYGTF